ncbi:MAG: nitroreductase A [Firmicutes bacterium ADurb.Bin182]|nr:MAG: nitroreductase A [Firmicutes bacterium ADurb.Bin182]
MNPVLENIRQRRSFKQFKKEQISEEQLQLILEAGLYAPTGNNRQGCIFTVLQGENLKRLGDAVREAFRRGECCEKRDVPDDYVCFYNAPTLILVSEDRNNFNGNSDCACALQNIFLAAASLGVASCWINQPRNTSDAPLVRALFDEFKIPKDHIVYGSAALGFADGEPRNIERRPGRVLRP